MKKILYILFYSAWGILTLIALPFYFFVCWLLEKDDGKEIENNYSIGRFDDDYA